MSPVTGIQNLISLLHQHRYTASNISAEITHENMRKKFAEIFCATVIDKIWQIQVLAQKPEWHLLESSVEFSALDDIARQLSVDIALLASRIDSALCGYFVGTLYTSLLPPSLRSRWGVYYTPPPLAERLIGDVKNTGIDLSNSRILDPACGGAAFLAPIASHVWRAMSKKGKHPRDIVDHISANLSGVEIDPFAAWMSQVLTELRIFNLLASANQRLGKIVRVGDAFDCLVNEPGKYDLVIGNPPYGRISLTAKKRQEYERSLYGHANLYGLFTDLALRISVSNGIVAFVTPTSFLAGQYYKSLRLLLSQEAPPVILDFVHQRDGVFENVLQETVLAVFKKQKEKNLLTKVNSIHAERSNGGLKITTISRHKIEELGEKPWLIPRTEKQRVVLERAANMPNRLSHYGFTVSTGPLVWNRHKDQLRSEKSLTCVPLIWAESVLPDGTFRFRSVRPNHKPFFELRGTQEHLLIRTTCILVQRTTAKEQNRRLVAAVLPQEFLERFGSAAVVENHLNVIKPTKGLFPTVALRAVSALLNSQTVDEVFRCISGSVAVSAYELNALPLPDPERLGELDQLISGKCADNQAIEEYIANLYGLN